MGCDFAWCQDPSGSIGAGIHKDILQAEEGFSPGAVLMLEQVSPSLLGVTCSRVILCKFCQCLFGSSEARAIHNHVCFEIEVWD